MPAAMAALASWSSRISFCVMTMSRSLPCSPAKANTNSRIPPTVRNLPPRGWESAGDFSPASRPETPSRPQRSSSATASMSPEPQIPCGGISPITPNRTVPFSSRTLSMAPSPALMPFWICAPSKAGPAAAEQASSHPL